MPNKYKAEQNYNNIHNLRVVNFKENALPKTQTAVQDKKYTQEYKHEVLHKTIVQTKQNSIEKYSGHISEQHDNKDKYKLHNRNPNEHTLQQDSKVLSNIRFLYRKSRGRLSKKYIGDAKYIKDIGKTYNEMYSNSIKSRDSRSDDLRPPTFPYRRERLKVLFFQQSSPRITGRSLFTSRRKKAPRRPVKGSQHNIQDLEPVKQIYSTEEMKLKLDEKNKEENGKMEKGVKIEVIKSKTNSFRSDGTHSTGFRSSTQVVLRCEPSTMLRTVQFPQDKGPAAMRLPARSRTTVAKCTPQARGKRKGVVLRRPQGTCAKVPGQDKEKCDCFPKNLYKMSLKRCLKLWLLCLWSPCLAVAAVCWFVSYPFRYIEGCTCRRDQCQCKSTVRRAWAKSAFNTRSRFLRKNAGPVCSKKCKAMRRRNTYLTDTAGTTRFPCRCDPTFGKNFRSSRFRDRVSRVEREDHLHLVQKERELIASLAKEHASRADYARSLQAQLPRARGSAHCDPCLVKLQPSVMAAQIKTKDLDDTPTKKGKAKNKSPKGKAKNKSPNTVSASQVAVKTSKKKIKPKKIPKPKKVKASKTDKRTKKHKSSTDDSDEKSKNKTSSSDTTNVAKKDKFSTKFKNKLNNLKSKVKGRLSKTEVQSFASRVTNKISSSISGIKIRRSKSDTSSEDGAKRKKHKKKKNKKKDDADYKKSRGRKSRKPLNEVYVQTCIAKQQKPFKKKRLRNIIFDHHNWNEGEIQAYKEDKPHKRKKSKKRKKEKESRKSEVKVTKKTVAPICVEGSYVIGSPEALERKARLAKVCVEREKQRMCADEDLRVRQAIEFGDRSKTRDPIMRRDRLDLMSPTYASTYRKRLVRRGYPLDHRTVFKHDITYPDSRGYLDPTCGSPIDQDMRRRQYYTRKYKMRRNNMIFKCLRCKAADFGTRQQNVIVPSRYTNSPCRNNTNQVCRDIGAFHVNYYGWRAFRITTNRLCHQISRFSLLVCGICIWCPIFLIEHMIFKLCVCICS
ncbi:hypothetical protein JYU34_006689 [Plutella xylostella]|uniref:Uncharacterized protein n=1 Tax=Plutella xylostella TaxID=51655 RepID=A0ABQ7QSL9_PLUXY|nr:hypothetical protein JYU34_006689 [Plutella xylostella]